MGDATRLIEWTGERCVPWTDDIQVIYEHYHRYAFAAQLTAGKRVLDLATGEGYGAALLAGRAREVIGVDIDPDTVAHARASYPAPNLSFEVGSITDPQLLAGHGEFDVITCFEAIEHVAEQDRVLQLAGNRLAEHGLFLVSTPDVTVYTHDHGNENPFHVKELDEAEFTALLRGTFRNVVVQRQNVAAGSLIVAAGPQGARAGAQGAKAGAQSARAGAQGPKALAQSLRREPGGGWAVHQAVPHTYLLAIASNGPLPKLPAVAVLVDPDLTLVGAGRAEADRLRRQCEDSRAEATRLSRQYQESRAEADKLGAVAAALERQRAELVRAAEVAQCRLDELDERLRRTTAELAAARRSVADLQGQREELAGQLAASTARVDWLAGAVARLEQRCAELAATDEDLRRELSSTAHRLVARYRATVERAAPRGTRRRGLYERAFGRPPGVLPEPAAAAAPTEPAAALAARGATAVAAPAAEDLSPVAVTTSEQPVASIAVPVHGKWAYTRRCLASIERASAAAPFEVIVVDDDSPDDTAQLVAASHGVRLVRTPANLGFVGACNLGARAARGRVVVFLNNDTEVEPGWLDALLNTMAADEKIGLVGAKLVYPDGRLQECGGIVWADGSGWNYGRGLDPREPEFNVLRDVDYCSGAAIMVRKEVLDRLGGFDERYAPAYYEDTDLAFAVRAAGLRTVVQPAAVVVHHEGVSNGTDTNNGIKRFQEVNRERFRRKWSAALADHLRGPSGGGLWLARQRTSAGHGGGLVLVVDHQVPMPDMDSGSVRMAAILDELVRLGQRVLLFPANGGLPQPYSTDLQQRGVTVVADRERQSAVLREVGHELRFALLSRPNVAWQLLTELRATAPRCLIGYDTVDLHFLRLHRQAGVAEADGRADEAAGLRRQAEASRELETGLARASDLTFVVSESEREVLAALVPDADIRVLSNVHRVPSRPATIDGRSGVIFVGSFDHPPNRDAVHWLAGEVMPLVRASVPGTLLHVVGSNAPQSVLDLAGPGVVVYGWVRSLAPLYSTARVAAAPLRFGAGVKGKVGESAGLGVPTVGTPLAFEGMRLRPGHDVLVGETAAELAEAIAGVLTDDDLWHRLSAAGADAVAAQFGPEAARETLAAVLEKAGAVATALSAGRA